MEMLYCLVHLTFWYTAFTRISHSFRNRPLALSARLLIDMDLDRHSLFTARVFKCGFDDIPLALIFSVDTISNALATSTQEKHTTLTRVFAV